MWPIQAVPQLGLRLGVCSLAMTTLLDLVAPKGAVAQRPREVRLVGRLFASKASCRESSAVDEKQLDQAKGLGYSLHLHLL